MNDVVASDAWKKSVTGAMSLKAEEVDEIKFDFGDFGVEDMDSWDPDASVDVD